MYQTVTSNPPVLHYNLWRTNEFEQNTLGFYLENHIETVNNALLSTLELPHLGLNKKEQALRQVLLAIRNMAHYYGYKKNLNDLVPKLTETQHDRFNELAEMVEAVDKNDYNWIELRDRATEFIRVNFDYYLEQPKVISVQPYLYCSTEMTELKITGHFYYTADIELVLENKSTYKPKEVDPNHTYITFWIKVEDLGLDNTQMKNSYSMALLKCPWKYQGALSSKKVEADFEIVLGVLPPVGKVHYVVIDQLSLGKDIGAPSATLPDDKEELAKQPQYKEVEFSKPLSWTNSHVVCVKDSRLIKNIYFEDFTGEIFSIKKLPAYLTLDVIEKRQHYLFKVNFPQ